MKRALVRKVHERQQVLRPPTTSTITSTRRLQSVASFAQQRILLDEQIYFDPSISPALYNFLMPLTIKYGAMSIVRIRSAIVGTLTGHAILRTAVRFNEENGQLEQIVQSIVNDSNYSFQVTRGARSPEEIDAILTTESTTHFAEINRGLVVRCHLIKMSFDNADLLYKDDLIIFVFHHIAFDMSSVSLFLDAFTQAYDLAAPRASALQYIDYALYEHAQLVDPAEDSKMNQARRFWSRLMDGYDWNKDVSLQNNTATKTKTRSGRGHCVAFDLDSNLVNAQVQCASLNDVSMFQLGLTYFFVFLYKFSNTDTEDLCVVSPTHNRSLPEIKSMIGMFVNLLPYRIKVNPAESFINLLLRVRGLCIELLEHAQLPYQQMIGSVSDSTPPRIPFLFQYESTMALLTYGTTMERETKDATMKSYTGRDWSHGNSTALHDLSLTMTHNHHERTTHFILECSTDVHEERAISLMARRFQHFLSQLFFSSVEMVQFDRTLEPISKLSLLLPEDAEEIQRTVFHRLSNVVNTGMSSDSFVMERCMELGRRVEGIPPHFRGFS